MTSEKSAGRTIGILVLLHLLIGLMVPFIILDFTRASSGSLPINPDHANQVRVAVFLLCVGSAMASAISVAAFPVIRRYSSGWAIWLVSLSVAAFSLQMVDNGRLLTMLSLSQRYTDLAAANPGMYQELAYLAGASRKWSHYTYLLVAVSWIFLLFAALFRLRLVPRSLAGAGMLCALLQIGAVSVRAILGYAPAMRLAVPLGPLYLSLALWLIVKGFNARKVASSSEYSGIAAVS